MAREGDAEVSGFAVYEFGGEAVIRGEQRSIS